MRFPTIIMITLATILVVASFTGAHHRPDHQPGGDGEIQAQLDDHEARITALETEVFGEPTPEPDPTPVPDPDPTPTPEPEPEPTPTPEPDPTPTPEPDNGEPNDVDAWLFDNHHWPVEPLSVVDTSQLEQPVAGEPCPNWVGRSHVTQAPDGDFYLTWRPMLDPQYGCHFTHEHGSNPDRVPGSILPPFGYGEPHHIRESEYGYKVHAVHATEPGIQVLITTHFGTAEPHKAVCQRFHWNNFQFVQNGELVANFFVMGDFGAALHNDTHMPLDPNNLHQCVDPKDGNIYSQAELQGISGGKRLNPVCTGPNGTDCGTFYYPWQVSIPRDVIGLETWAYTLNTPGVVASCWDMDCLQSRHHGGKGIWRFIGFNPTFGVPQFGFYDPGYSADGIFYTNPWGDELRNGDEPDAVQQFIKPGTEIRLTRASDQHSYFPDGRLNPQPYGDLTLTELALGDPNIAQGHNAVTDPNNWIGELN